MEFSCDYSRKDAVNLGIDFGEKKKSGLSTICFSGNAFCTNSVHFKNRMLHNEFHKWIC